MYVLLCGHPPFRGVSIEEICSKILNQTVEFKSDEWCDISKEAQDLVKKMLTGDINKRISASQALQDKWFSKSNTSNKPLCPKTLENFGKFYADNKIQAAIYGFIATNIMSIEEQKDLHKLFLSIDKNGDGKLSEGELIEVYCQICNGDINEARFIVRKILASSDHNFSGKIDYTGLKKKKN